ncbi:hypothetical protein LSH36_951g04003 [Paralvinella palmiformis]|uniref:Monocarboxylate transporter n=1 Tax=Paralvinella palmiformis TaxID=53620 RepID=A0AAD9IYL6_9ANNE|nr:hypothetical protein LSH36_951g04003 [Paralvinella palmiformis]
MASSSAEVHPATSEERYDLKLWLMRRHYSLDTGWSWAILAGSCLGQVIISLIYVVGIFNVIFLEVFQDGDRQTTAWLGAVQSSFLSLFALPAGYIHNKLGPRITVIIGALSGGLGFFLAYFSNGFVSLLFTFGCLVGIGNGLVNLPIIIIMGSYFQRYRNLALATSTATVGLGTLLLPPIINYCTDIYGWRGCIYLNLLVIGGIMRPQHLPSDLLEMTLVEEKGAASPTKKEYLASSLLSLALADSTTKGQNRDARCLSLCELRRNSLFEGTQNESYRSQSYGDLTLPARSQRTNFANSMEVGKETEPEKVKKLLVAAGAPGLKDNVSDGQPQRDDSDSKRTTRNDVTGRPSLYTIMRKKNLMLLNFHYFSATAANFTTYLHFPAYFISKGATKTDLTVMMTVIGISNIVSRVFSGILTNSVDNGVLLLYLAAGGLSSFLLFLCPLLSDFYFGRLLFAFAFSLYGNAISA